MDISTPPPAASPATAPAPPPKPQDAVLSSDFETFLKMLTAQMRNQDPLNPVDSTDFAAQLANFSTVEQQVLTNDLLESLNTRIGQIGMGQLSGWIGMTARAEMPVNFAGAPVTLTLPASPGAQSARLVVRDDRGREVATQEVPPAGGTFEWAGSAGNGTPLPAGLYTLEVEARLGDEPIATRPVETEALIAEARQTTAGVELVMDDGQVVAAGRVAGLRRPEV